MSDQSIHFSSNTDNWETPKEIFDPLNNEFNFDVDICASENNSKCKKWTDDLELYVDLVNDIGLEEEETLWMNPPYSRGKQKKMIGFANDLFLMGKTIVCLLPSRTDTKMFHQYIWDEKTHKPRTGVEVRLIKGRIKFELDGKKKDAAPFPSMIVIFRG